MITWRFLLPARLDALSGALELSGAREHSVYQRCNSLIRHAIGCLPIRDQIQRVLVNLFRNALKKAMVSSTHLCLKKQGRRCHD